MDHLPIPPSENRHDIMTTHDPTTTQPTNPHESTSRHTQSPHHTRPYPLRTDNEREQTPPTITMQNAEKGSTRGTPHKPSRNDLTRTPTTTRSQSRKRHTTGQTETTTIYTTSRKREKQKENENNSIGHTSSKERAGRSSDRHVDGHFHNLHTGLHTQTHTRQQQGDEVHPRHPRRPRPVHTLHVEVLSTLHRHSQRGIRPTPSPKNTKELLLEPNTQQAATPAWR